MCTHVYEYAKMNCIPGGLALSESSFLVVCCPYGTWLVSGGSNKEQRLAAGHAEQPDDSMGMRMSNYMTVWVPDW